MYVTITYISYLLMHKYKKIYTVIILFSIFKTYFNNLRLIPSTLTVKTLAKSKTGLNFFMNTIKTKTKAFAYFFHKIKTKVFTLNLKPV